MNATSPFLYTVRVFGMIQYIQLKSKLKETCRAETVLNVNQCKHQNHKNEQCNF